MFNNIRTKMIGVIIAVTVLGIGVIVSAITLHASVTQEKAAFKLVDETAQKNAEQLGKLLNDGISSTRAVASSFKGMKQGGVCPPRFSRCHAQTGSGEQFRFHWGLVMLGTQRF